MSGKHLKVKPFTSKYHKRMYRVLEAENMEVIDDNLKMGYSTQQKALKAFFFRIHNIDKVKNEKTRKRYIEILCKYSDFQKSKKDKQRVKQYKKTIHNNKLTEYTEKIIDTANVREFDNFDVKISSNHSLKTITDKKEIHFGDLNYFSSERTINDYAMYAPKEEKQKVIEKISKLIVKLSSPERKKSMENSLCLDLFEDLQLKCSKAKEIENVTNISLLVQSYFKFKRSAIINGEKNN